VVAVAQRLWHLPRQRISCVIYSGSAEAAAQAIGSAEAAVQGIATVISR